MRPVGSRPACPQWGSKSHTQTPDPGPWSHSRDHQEEDGQASVSGAHAKVSPRPSLCPEGPPGWSRDSVQTR